jgi:hypothetical protein
MKRSRIELSFSPREVNVNRIYRAWRISQWQKTPDSSDRPRHLHGLPGFGPLKTNLPRQSLFGHAEALGNLFEIPVIRRERPPASVVNPQPAPYPSTHGSFQCGDLAAARRA